MKVSNPPVSSYRNALPINAGSNRPLRDGPVSPGFSTEDQKRVAQVHGQGKTLPAEKIIEGELLEKSQGLSGVSVQTSSVSKNAFIDLLESKRFSNREVNLPGTQQRSMKTAVEGINAYLHNAGLDGMNNTNTKPSHIDIFA